MANFHKMGEDSRLHNNYKSYRHGIVCYNCIVRRYLEGIHTVRTVCIGTLVEVHGVEEENIYFYIVNNDNRIDDEIFICQKGDVLFIPENLWGPLLAVEQEKRLQLVQDANFAEALANLDIGHNVKVMESHSKDICIGSITFRNAISKLGSGIYFGLKITHPKEDIQSITENFSLLQPGTKGFPRGCDIVVSVDNICPINIKLETSSFIPKKEHNNSFTNDSHQFKKSCKNGGPSCSPTFAFNLCISNINTNFSENENKSLSGICSKHDQHEEEHSMPLAIGEKIVYFNSDTPEKGTVKWLGYIKNQMQVGIEFENQIGSGTGTVNGVKLFEAKCGHAAFMPPESLIKLSDFQMNTFKECNNKQKTNNNNYGSFQSNKLCCSLGHNLEEKNMFKINTFPNSKYTSHHAGFDFEDESLEDHSEGELFSNGKYMMENSLISSAHCPSRRFDSVRTKEKKIDNNKWSKFMENNIAESKELVINLQNSCAAIQKSANKEINGVYQNLIKQCEFHNFTDSGVKDSDRKTDHCEKLLLKQTAQVKETFEPHNSGQSSSDESCDYYDTPKQIPDHMLSDKLDKGSVVELIYKGQPCYGVIRWKGYIRLDGDGQSPCLIAGVEMENERDGFTDGTFFNKRYFQCNPRKALFVPLSECRKDSRFSEEIKSSDCIKINGELSFTSASIDATSCIDKTFGQLDCPVIEGTLPPLNISDDLEEICGKNKGIQGHHNSCYLDATLFAMFAFTSVFDSLLYRPPANNDIPQYSEVQRVLKEEIVNPLRKNLYVRADRVMKLRTLLEDLSSVSGLTCDEKDPEEFLNSLLAQILKAEPFLKLSSGQEAFHYQLFVEKDERLTFPSVQQLFEQSFVTSDIKLKQIPSCLIIQMPRFGKSFKMYSRILPPQFLDITDVMENSPRQCTVCGKLAEYECKDCFGQSGIGNGLESISYCKTCLETAHNHHCRMRHSFKSITVPFEFFDLQEHCSVPRIFMELFAVVCIETSHYVSFVKCGSGSDAPWCFFDSMADRKGEQNGYNIPEMVACPDLPYWLSEEGAKALKEMKDERQLPEHAKRLFCDAYMCLYQSPDIMMYR